MKLQVLMSTYNGEKFLRQQLDSILSQTLLANDNWNVEIRIRDDASSDKTTEILEEYSLQNSCISYTCGENLGVIGSFFELMRTTPQDVDYIALSDQDDVWMNDKLETAVTCLESHDAAIPQLYCGRSIPTDEDLNPIGSIFFGENVHPSFGNALVENICTGCTAVCNRSMIELLRYQPPAFTVMHDWWVYLLASCFGEVFFDPSPHMYYRQHSLNTVGLRKSYWGEFVVRVKRFRGNRYNISRQIQALNEFCEANKLSPDENKLSMITDVLGAQHSCRARIHMLRNKQIYRQRRGDNLIFKLIFLSGTI